MDLVIKSNPMSNITIKLKAEQETIIAIGFSLIRPTKFEFPFVAGISGVAWGSFKYAVIEMLLVANVLIELSYVQLLCKLCFP